jgi:hypothetical protein
MICTRPPAESCGGYKHLSSFYRDGSNSAYAPLWLYLIIALECSPVQKQTISIEGNINDSLSSVARLVACLSPLRETGEQSDYCIDLSKLRYLGPDGAAMLAGSVLEARGRQIHVDVTWPTAPGPLRAFIRFSGMEHFLDGVSLPDLHDPLNVTIPLRPFRQSRHTDAHPILELLARFGDVSEDLKTSLEIAVNETVQNIVDHASSPIGGLGCARYMTAHAELRVSIMDWGDGILTTLRRKYPDTVDDRHALERVLFGGFSALSRRNNLGRGIDNLRLVVTQALRGSVFILTGGAAVEVKGSNEPRYVDVHPPFRGTAVCFTLPRS